MLHKYHWARYELNGLGTSYVCNNCSTEAPKVNMVIDDKISLVTWMLYKRCPGCGHLLSFRTKAIVETEEIEEESGN